MVFNLYSSLSLIHSQTKRVKNYYLKENKMELHEFIDKQKKELDQFKSWWMKNNKSKNVSNFPLNLEVGEWMEQFMLYVDCEIKS